MPSIRLKPVTRQFPEESSCVERLLVLFAFRTLFAPPAERDEDAAGARLPPDVLMMVTVTLELDWRRCSFLISSLLNVECWKGSSNASVLLS